MRTKTILGRRYSKRSFIATATKGGEYRGSVGRRAMRANARQLFRRAR